MNKFKSTICSIREFLRECDKHFPIMRGNVHHSITLVEHKIVLTLFTDNRWRQVFLEDGDLNRDPKELIIEIIELLERGKVGEK